MENMHSSLDSCLFLLPISIHVFVFLKRYHQNLWIRILDYISKKLYTIQLLLLRTLAYNSRQL